MNRVVLFTKKSVMFTKAHKDDYISIDGAVLLGLGLFVFVLGFIFKLVYPIPLGVFYMCFGLIAEAKNEILCT